MSAKPKRLDHKFKPNIKAIAKSHTAIRTLSLSRQIVKEVVKGESFEVIADKFDITESEAAKIARATIERWSQDLGQTANEARALDLHRYNEMLIKLHPLVFPEPAIDNETGLLTIPKPDYIAMKLMLDIMDKRAKIYGYEAADKLQEQKHEILKRMYMGVATNSKGEIDL